MYCNCFKTFFFYSVSIKYGKKHELSTLSKDNKDQQMIKMVTKKNSVLEKNKTIILYLNVLILMYIQEAPSGLRLWMRLSLSWMNSAASSFLPFTNPPDLLSTGLVV